MALSFEWDPRKAQINAQKHGVKFAEACTTFADPLARIFPDEEHSASERREILVGHSSKGRLPLVCFVETELDRIRIVSARSATKGESEDYEEHRTS